MADVAGIAAGIAARVGGTIVIGGGTTGGTAIGADGRQQRRAC
ncbi:MAG: hypothetical protein AB7K64_18215 [Variibacter sp.]